MAIAFSKPLTCCKSLGYASIRSGGGEIFEFRCLGICKVGPGIDKFQGTKKWLGSILEAIEEDEVTFNLESALQGTVSNDWQNPRAPVFCVGYRSA